MKIKTRFDPSDNNIVIVELSGFVDQSNSLQVEEVISDIIKSEKLNIIFDLSNLVYMSSAGWGIFVGEIKNLRQAGGDIKIASMSPEVFEVFQMLEFYHIIEDYATVDEAVKSFRRDASRALADQTDTIRIKDLDPMLKSNGDVNDDGDNHRQKKSEAPAAIPVKEKTEAAPVGPKKADVSENDKAPETTTEEVRTRKYQEAVKEQPALPKVWTNTKSKETPQKRDIDITMLPLPEKVKHVVGHYPLLSPWQIRKMLRHEKFGKTKVGILQLRKLLKMLNLDDKKKRYRFYRSI